jgi:hypothetical protein
MGSELVALYADPRRAELAIRDLEALGVDGLRLASPAPFPVVHRVNRPGTERLLGWLALAGAVAGLATAVALQVYASLVHPFVVGGKPVLAWPAFAIVWFELTMLGAGATNFVALAVLSMLARRGVPRAAKEAVVSDRLVLVVPIQGRTADATQAIRNALAGAEELLP